MTERHDAQLYEAIQAVSCKTGNFTLTSGKTSNFYIDLKRLMMYPEFLYKMGQALHALIYGLFDDVGVIAGVEFGAVPLINAIGLYDYELHRANSEEALYLKQCVIRKGDRLHGIESNVIGKDAIKYESNTVIVDDVLTTGGSIKKAMDIMNEFTDVVGYVVLVDREEADMDLGITGASVFTKKDLLSSKYRINSK